MAGSNWQPTGVIWAGSNGSRWDLSTGAEGVYLNPGVEGFGFGDVELFEDESPGLQGGRFLGSRRRPRTVFLPVTLITDGGSRDFGRLHTAFLDSLSEDEPGRLTVVTELSSRFLDMRLAPDSGDAYEIDPYGVGAQPYGLTLRSMSSDWIGKEVTGGWLPPEPARNLWNVPDGVFFVMQGKDTSSATVTNPGSYASYPTWMVDGYTPAARVGVAGEFVDIPFPVPNGKCLVLETDPRLLSATMYDVPAEFRALPISERVVGVHLLNPVKRTRELGEVSFAPIPRGKDIPLSLSVSGTGLMQLKFPTLWKSAF